MQDDVENNRPVLQRDELAWISANRERCLVCKHMLIFHVRMSDCLCIVADCGCDGVVNSTVDEKNEARRMHHIEALEACEIDNTFGHVDTCSICQEHIATIASDTVYEFYNYSKDYRRS